MGVNEIRYGVIQRPHSVDAAPPMTLFAHHESAITNAEARAEGTPGTEHWVFKLIEIVECQVQPPTVTPVEEIEE